MTPEQFRTALKKGKVAPAYFFTGAETLRKREALDALIATVPEGVRAFNVQVFHAFEADLAEVLTAAGTLPFLGSRRVVVLRDVEKMRLDQAGRNEQLEAYLKAPPLETVFVVTTEDADRAKSLVKKHGAALTVVAFELLKGPALVAAVRAEAVRLGCTIEAPAVAALIAATGEDQARVFNELDKLRSAVGAGGVVDGEAVARYAAGYEHHGFNDIVDAIGRRDLHQSLRLLGEVTIKDEEYLLLLGMLGKRLRVLWYLVAPAQEVPKVFNVTWQLGKLAPDARRFTRAEIEQGLQGLGLLDERVKSTAVAPRLLLEHFLLGFLPAR